MRKLRIVPLALLLAMLLLVLTSCGNMKLGELTNTFSEARLFLPDGSLITGQVESWTYYANSGMQQVKIDGVIYLVHSSDCVLIAK